MGIFSPDTITDFVRKGDLQGVRRRLELGDDVNERRSFNNTPLIEAARYNVVEILELLIEHGADLELTNSNDLTALHAAIDERKTSTAIILARHGASANQLGLFGRTPLQCAIKRNLLDVTAELLANGADPMVPSDSAKIAMEYVRSGPNQEELKKLLTAYSNVDAAIEAKNVDAITVCLRKALTGDRSAKMSGIDAALQLKHAEAVTTILQMSLASDTLVDMVEKYRVVELWLMNTDNVDWREILRQLGEDFGRGVLALLMDTGDVALLKQLVKGTAEPNWIQNLRLSNSWTALHLAAALSSGSLVRYLLVECGCNPLLVTSDDKTAHELAMEIDSESKVSRMLLQFMKQRAFLNQTALLLRTEVTVVGLRQLLGKMTNVYDLRIIFSLGFRALSPVEMNAVLTVAFNEVIREKLVFDDSTAVFFKLGLQECKRQNCISDMEQLVWDLKAIKVNVKNSHWIHEINNLLQEVEGKLATAERNSSLLHNRFSTLQQELTKCDECTIQQHVYQHNVSLLSSALILCGGPAMKELFGATFDVWDPAKLLAVLGADHVDGFLGEKTNKFVYKGGVEVVLNHSLIDPMEFATVLRFAAKFERHTERSNPETIKPLFPVKATNIHFKATVLAAIHRHNTNSNGGDYAANKDKNASPKKISSSPRSEVDMEAFPYHYAVRYSEGNLEQFLELVQYIKEDDGDINQTLTLYVRPVKDSTSSREWKAIEASALVYASFLDYVEIVKWFLERVDVVESEKIFLTAKPPHSDSKSAIEISFRAPASNA